MSNTLIALAAAIVAVWPLAAQAQELTPDQVRLFYADQGYTVDAPSRWGDGVSMLAIHDPTGELQGWPVARAFVFSQPVEHSSAQLLAGYGTPQWQDNVAIVRYDPTAFPPEPDCRPTPVEIRS